MIYELGTFVKGLGGVDKAAAALDEFRAECDNAGYGGVHIMACDYKLNPDMVRRLSIDSATIYNFIHWVRPFGNPDYSEWAEKGARRFDAAKERLGLPAYFAHASVGWDANPRWPRITENCRSLSGIYRNFSVTSEIAAASGRYVFFQHPFAALLTARPYHCLSKNIYCCA